MRYDNGFGLRALAVYSTTGVDKLQEVLKYRNLSTEDRISIRRGLIESFLAVSSNS
jgi:hypothetical protein